MNENTQKHEPATEKQTSRSETTREKTKTGDHTIQTKKRKHRGERETKREYYMPFELIARSWHIAMRGPYVSLILSMLTLVAVAVYTVYAGRQWRSMVKQADLMNQSLTESINTREIENRAYVTAVEVLPLRVHAQLERDRIPEIERYFSMQTVIRNSGHTPAKEVRHELWIAVTTPDGNLDNLYWGEPIPSNAPFTLAGNVDLPRLVGRFTGVPDRELLRRFGMFARMVLKGRVTYLDFFNKPHRTEYCFISPDLRRDVWNQCEKGNYMD